MGTTFLVYVWNHSYCLVPGKTGERYTKCIKIGMWAIMTGGLVGTIIHVSGNLESIFEDGGSTDLINLFYIAAGGRYPLLPGVLNHGRRHGVDSHLSSSRW